MLQARWGQEGREPEVQLTTDLAKARNCFVSYRDFEPRPRVPVRGSFKGSCRVPLKGFETFGVDIRKL